MPNINCDKTKDKDSGKIFVFIPAGFQVHSRPRFIIVTSIGAFQVGWNVLSLSFSEKES